MPPIEDDNLSNVVYPPRARSAPAVAEPPRAVKSAIFAAVAMGLALLAAIPPYLLWSRGMPEARRPAYIFGRYILGPFLFAGVLGYVACRIRGRSRAAFYITFGIILLFIIATNGSKARRSTAGNQQPADVQAFINEAEQIKSEMRELEAAGQLSEMSAADLQVKFDRLDAVMKKASGKEAQILRASYEVPRRLMQAQIRSRVPLERFKKLGGLETRGVTSKEQLKKRLGPIKEYRKHVVNALAVTKNWRSVMVEGGKAEGFTPAETTRLIGGDAAWIEATMKQARSIHTLEIESADAMKGALEVLISEWGAWQVDESDNAVVFENDEAMEKYNKHMERLGQNEEKHDQLTHELLRPRG